MRATHYHKKYPKQTAVAMKDGSWTVITNIHGLPINPPFVHREYYGTYYVPLPHYTFSLFYSKL